MCRYFERGNMTDTEIYTMYELCRSRISNRREELKQGKWIREYLTVEYGGKKYQCQLSIKRKGKKDEVD